MSSNKGGVSLWQNAEGPQSLRQRVRDVGLQRDTQGLTNFRRYRAIYAATSANGVDVRGGLFAHALHSESLGAR